MSNARKMAEELASAILERCCRKLPPEDERILSAVELDDILEPLCRVVEAAEALSETMNPCQPKPIDCGHAVCNRAKDLQTALAQLEKR